MSQKGVPYLAGLADKECTQGYIKSGAEQLPIRHVAAVALP